MKYTSLDGLREDYNDLSREAIGQIKLKKNNELYFVTVCKKPGFTTVRKNTTYLEQKVK